MIRFDDRSNTAGTLEMVPQSPHETDTLGAIHSRPLIVLRHESDPEDGNRDEVDRTAFHDPWLFPEGAPLRRLTDAVWTSLQPSDTRSVRSRKPRQDAIANRLEAIGNIVANLVDLLGSPSADIGADLAIPTARTAATRYERQDFPKRHLASALADMEEAGWITVRPFEFKRRATTILPSPKFFEHFDAVEAAPGDIGRRPGEETIWLSARTGAKGFAGQAAPKALVYYQDTEETKRLREEVKRINAMLSAAEITFKGQPVAPISLRRVFVMRSQQEPPSFSLGGRLSRGFWMNLRKDQRGFIQIGGVPIADLDFTAMWPRLAYLNAGLPSPEADPYAVPGLSRKVGKLALLSLLSRSAPMMRLSPELRAVLPEHQKAGDLVSTIKGYHPRIAHLFASDYGLELMRQESDIMVALTLELAEQGIPVLPFHDGLHCRRSDVPKAVDAMRGVTRQMLGATLPVAEKPISMAL